VTFRVRRQLGALLILSCAGVLVLGVGQARAESSAEPSPTRLWKEYPLEPRTVQAPKQRVPLIPAPAVANPSSPDWMLGIGGLALVVLILADAVFLALLARALRVGAA
jgi:hypothetical protein